MSPVFGRSYIKMSSPELPTNGTLFCGVPVGHKGELEDRHVAAVIW